MDQRIRPPICTAVFSQVCTEMLCDALHDLDIRTRAVISIVNDWKDATDEQKKGDKSQPAESQSSVETVWSFPEIGKLLIQVLESSRRVVDNCKSTSPKKIVDERESGQVRTLLQEYLKSTGRFRGATSEFISLLNRLTLEGANSAAVAVQGVLDALTETTKFVEEFLELLEWEELNRQALSPGEFKQLAAYLLKTGKASA